MERDFQQGGKIIESKVVPASKQSDYLQKEINKTGTTKVRHPWGNVPIDRNGEGGEE